MLYDRLIEQSNVQMFISAGNSGPGENTVGDPSVATKVDERRRLHHRRDLAVQLRLDRARAGPTTCTRSARAARGRTAASSRTSSPPARPSRRRRCGRPAGRWPACTRCRPGTAMFNGTSMASPQAAGAAALLVSAAKQAGVQHQPAQLRQALQLVGPVPRPATAPSSRATGSSRVGAAWEPPGDQHQDRRHHLARSRSIPRSSSSWPRRASASASTTARASRSAQPYTRTYTFTRTSGGWRIDDLQPVAGRQRRDLLARRASRRSRCRRTQPQTLARPRSTRRRRAPLGDPQPRRSGQPGHRVPDVEHRGRGPTTSSRPGFSHDHHRHRSVATRR